MSGEDGLQVIVQDGSRITSDEIEAIEKVMQLYAANWLEKHGFRASEFNFKLSQKQNCDTWIIPGETIQVSLRWPYAFDNFNSVLRSLAQTYRKHRLRRVMELVPYAIRREGKKWLKQVFSDESQIILDLVPRNRISVKRRESITLTDSRTGISVETSIEHKSNSFDGSERDLWFKLSRKVMDIRPETLEELKDD